MRIFVFFLIPILFLAGCQVQNGQSSMSGTRFYAVTDLEFVEFVFEDGRFSVNRVCEFEEMFDPEGFTTDGTHLLAWDGHSMEITNVEDCRSRSYGVSEYVRYAVTDGEDVYVAGYEDGIHVYRISPFGLEKIQDLVYVDGKRLRVGRLWLVGEKRILAKDLIGGRFHVFDFQGEPVVLSYFEHPYTWEISHRAEENRVYFVHTTTEYYPVVYEMDLSDPASPDVRMVFESRTDFTSPAFISEDLLVDHNGRVVSVETGDLLSKLDIEGHPVVYEKKVFFFGDRVVVFDLSNPSSPKFVETYDLPLKRSPWIFSDLYE